MNMRIYLYFFMTLLSSFALSGVNFNKIVRQKAYWQVRILVVLCTLSLGYLSSQLIIAFFNMWESGRVSVKYCDNC